MNTRIIGAIVGLALLAVAVIWLSGGNDVPPPQEDVQAPPIAERRGPVPGKLKQLAPRRRAGSQERPAGIPEQHAGSMRPENPRPGNARPGVARPAPRPTSAIVGMGADKGESKPPAAANPAAANNDTDFESLKNTALTNANPEERVNALSALHSFDDERVLPVIIGALSDFDREVRLAALQELGVTTDEPPLDVLAPVLNDSDPEVRLEALRMIGESEDERAKELARQALSDPDEDVRSEAEDILSLDSDDDE